MKFDRTVNQLLEDFNIFPKSQNAIQNGPDIGSTTGDINNTFPSKQQSIGGKLLPNKRDIKNLKKKAKNSPKEKPTKIRLEIQ